MAPVTKSRPLVALALTVLAALPFSITELGKVRRSGGGDFNVYYVAAQLVRMHAGVHIYDGADTGQNPQLRPAVPGTITWLAARGDGIAEPGLYVYPPTLADLLVPMTVMPLPQARRLWLALDFVCLLATAAALAWMAEFPLISWRALGLLAALLLFRTNLSAVYWGQVTLLLLLCWAVGVAAYARGRIPLSAMAIGLASAIKLTPLLIVLPMLCWREGRWLRWYAGTLAAFVVLVCAVNGPATLVDFALHVMPPMAGGIPAILNASLSGGVEMLGAGLRGVDVETTYFVPVAHADRMLADVLVALAVAAFAVVLFRTRKKTSQSARAETIALVAVMAAALAPVSWRHAWTVAFPLLFLLWWRAFREQASNARLCALAALTLAFSFIPDSLVARAVHGAAFGAVPLIVPIATIALVFYELTAGRAPAHGWVAGGPAAADASIN